MKTSDALDEINHILQWECSEPTNFDYFICGRTSMVAAVGMCFVEM